MAVDTGASSEGWHGAGHSWNFALQMVSLFITGTINLQCFTSTPARCSLIYMRLLLAGPFVLVKRWQWQCGWRMVNGEWQIRRRFVNSASKCLHAAQIFINIVYDRAYFIFSSTLRLFAACCHIHMHSVCFTFIMTNSRDWFAWHVTRAAVERHIERSLITPNVTEYLRHNSQTNIANVYVFCI